MTTAVIFLDLNSRTTNYYEKQAFILL